MITFNDLIICNDISIENLKENGGTFNYTAFRILDIVTRKGFNPKVYTTLNEEGHIVGYIIYYFNPMTDDAIQISHIAIEVEEQGKGYGSKMLKELMRIYSDYSFTADIDFGNTNSIELFKNNGFILSADSAKKRWRAKRGE